MTVNIMIPKGREIPTFRVKDPISTLTHFIAFVISIVAAPILLMKGAMDGKSLVELLSLAVFSLSMIFLYGASSSYHAFNLGEKKNIVLRKIDHAMIGVLVAGTYTPLCVISLRSQGGLVLLSYVWALSLGALVLKLFWINCPKWVSSVLYLLMGWACAPSLGKIYRALTPGGFRLLLLGGITYTIGALIYAMKIPALEKNKNFRSHELFHLFIMGGTLFQYLSIYFYSA
ncbi:MAG: hemolysin III family protein [Candidatus Ornithospirochaeta sp.]